MTKDNSCLEEYVPCSLDDKTLWSIGYYFTEFLRNKRMYGDDDMLLICLPKEYRELAKKVIPTLQKDCKT